MFSFWAELAELCHRHVLELAGAVTISILV